MQIIDKSKANSACAGIKDRFAPRQAALLTQVATGRDRQIRERQAER